MLQSFGDGALWPTGRGIGGSAFCVLRTAYSWRRDHEMRSPYFPVRGSMKGDAD